MDDRLGHDDIVAGKARIEPLADDAFLDQKPGRLVLLARREHLQHFGATHDRFDAFGGQLTRHFIAHFFEQVVDHVIIAQRDFLADRQRTRLGIGTDVETDQRRAAGRCQRNVAFGDRTHAGAQDTHLDLVGRNAVQRIDDRFDRTLHVATNDHRIFDDLRAQCREHIFKVRRHRCGALAGDLFLTIGGNLTSARFIFHDRHLVACHRHARQAQHLDRDRRTGGLDLLALVIDQRTHLAAFRADDERVADLERTATHQHGGDSATALVELRLDHIAFGGAIGVGGQFHQLGLEQDLLDQLVQPGLLERGYLHVLHVAAHILDHDFMFEQALTHLLRVGFGLVALVDSHDHRHAGRLGMIDRLDRLRHQPVVGRHHQNDDVRHIGAARAHFRERLVAGRIEESERVAALGLHLIGTDMLGDAAGLARLHVGAAQRVEQAGLAVVDMAHDRDHRRARPERLGRVHIGRGVDLDIAVGHALDTVAEFLDQQLGRILVDRLVDGDGHAQLEQRLHQIGALLGHAVGEFLHGDALGHHHVAHLLLARLRGTAHMRAAFLLAGTAQRGEAAGAGAVVVGQRAVDGELAGLAAVVSARPALLPVGLLGLGALGRGHRREAARGRCRRGRAGRLRLRGRQPAAARPRPGWRPPGAPARRLPRRGDFPRRGAFPPRSRRSARPPRGGALPPASPCGLLPPRAATWPAFPDGSSDCPSRTRGARRAPPVRRDAAARPEPAAVSRRPVRARARSRPHRVCR